MQKWFNMPIPIYVIQNINRIKDKNHMTIAAVAEKAYDRIQHHFMMKALKKLKIQGFDLNIVKTT
jgi:hypothetical protein